MTDHSDLIAEMRALSAYPGDAYDRAASALSSQSLSLSEARALLAKQYGVKAGRAVCLVSTDGESVTDIYDIPAERLPHGYDYAEELEAAETALSEAREEIERLKGLVAGIRALSEPDREALKTAIRRGTADEVNGQPNGDIIVKGCEAAEYCDPSDAAEAFVEAIADELIASFGPVEADPVKALLAAYDAETDKLPLGHEDATRGASTYNWRKTVTRQLRELQAALSAASALENGPAGLADATNDPASSDLSSLRKGAEDDLDAALLESTAMRHVTGQHYSVEVFFATLDDSERFRAHLAARCARIRSALVSGSREDGA